MSRRRSASNLSCCSLISVLLLRTGPAASAAGGARAEGALAAAMLRVWAPGAAVHQHLGAASQRAASAAFAHAWAGGAAALRARACSLLLRGGCAGPARALPVPCSFCTKVHNRGDRCKADRTMASRAADGWCVCV